MELETLAGERDPSFRPMHRRPLVFGKPYSSLGKRCPLRCNASIRATRNESAPAVLALVVYISGLVCGRLDAPEFATFGASIIPISVSARSGFSHGCTDRICTSAAAAPATRAGERMAHASGSRSAILRVHARGVRFILGRRAVTVTCSEHRGRRNE